MQKYAKLFILILTFFLIGFPASGTEKAVSGNRPADISSIVKDIPCKYANVKEIHIVNENAPWIICIRDYHCQYDLQKNISSILYYLAPFFENTSLPVCIEGAAGEIDTDILASVPDENIRLDVCNYLMEKGKISGAEFYSIALKPDQRLTGVDNCELYNASYELYNFILTTYTGMKTGIDYIDSVCASIEAAQASEAAKNIFARGKTLFDDNFSFENFILGTEKYWKGLSDKEITGSLSTYADALHKKNSISSDRVVSLENKLIDSINRAGTSETNKEFLALYLRFQLGEVKETYFLEQLIAFAKKQKLFSAEYQELDTCAQLLSRFEQFDKDQLLVLCEKTYELLKEKYVSADDRDILHALETWQAVKKLFSLELTRRNFIARDQIISSADIENLFTQIKNATKKKPDEGSAVSPLSYEFFAQFQILLQKASTFYQHSIDRDAALFSNTVDILTRDKARAAVLITGGFHTSGLRELAKQRSFNYAIVEPIFGDSKYRNFYKDSMLNTQQPLDGLFPLLRANRLAPRVRLANMLADPVLTQQLIKEAILIAKLLSLTASQEFYDQLRALPKDQGFDPQETIISAMRAFSDKWMDQYKEIKAKKKQSLSMREYRDLETAMQDLVTIERAKILEGGGLSLGLQIAEARGGTVHLQVSLIEHQKLASQMGVAINDSPFEIEEKIGPFVFYFQRPEELPQFVQAGAEGGNKATTGKQSIQNLIVQINQLKKASVADPFNMTLKMQLAQRLHQLSQFLRFASKQERQAGNAAQAFLLRANAELYAGNIVDARLYFSKYLDLIPENERNLANQYFARGNVIRGQKISLTVTDEKGRSFVDSNGNEIRSPMFDETLTYGSEPSITIQRRLVELANDLDRRGKKYQAMVMRTAAKRLTDNSRNYHYYDVDLGFLSSSGRNAYHDSFLGQSATSYGAISDKRATLQQAEQAPPSVSYVYDPAATNAMIKKGDLRIVETGSGLASKPIPPEAISAVIVNRIHVQNAMAVLSQQPLRTMPLLDTDGNLVWKNINLEQTINQYADAFSTLETKVDAEHELVYTKTVKNPTKLIAFGDLHSDVDALLETLKASGVIDDQGTFIAEKGTAVVINGDFMDRGPGKTQKRMIETLMRLQKEAAERGATFTVVMGNHEAMFLSGNWFSASEKYLYDFLKELGLNPDESENLRRAFASNNVLELGAYRVRHPEAMKYIDFLRNLPIVVQVGGHVFVHGGPTKHFNALIEKALKARPEWTTQMAIDAIFKQVIKRQGFNSPFFEMNFNSILTGAPEFTAPEFISQADISEKFLSFFDGGRLICVGHNKALGLVGTGKPYDTINRVGPLSNIIKLDVGTNMSRNAQRREVEGRAYIVDPRQPDFVYSLTQSGQRDSLMQKVDRRYELLRTNAAFLYDILLAGKTAAPTAIPAQMALAKKEKPIPEPLMEFLKKALLIWAVDPGAINFGFSDITNTIMTRGEREIRLLQTRIGLLPKDTLPYHIGQVYLTYFDKIRKNEISIKDVSLAHFQDFLKQNDITFSPVGTKSVGDPVEYERDISRFYSAMYRSDIQPLSPEIIQALITRLDQIIKAYVPTAPYDQKMDPLIRTKYYLSQADKQINFRTLRSHDGNPGIFLTEEGTGVMGFVLDNGIYLSEPLLQKLWKLYQQTKQTAYLDRLVALAVHETHEYREDPDLSSEDRKRLHQEAEALEVLISGKGKTGSLLDDEIDTIISEWKEKIQDKTITSIEKFLESFRMFLKERGEIAVYSDIFQRMGIPIEAGVLDNIETADLQFGSISHSYPRETLSAILHWTDDIPALFSLIDEERFTEKELFILVELLSAPAEPLFLSERPLLTRDLIVPADTPQPKSIMRDATARSTVESSI